MIEKLRICFIDGVAWHSRGACWLNAAAEYTCYRVAIEKMHAHHLALEFNDRDVHEESFVPFRPGVDISHRQREFSVDQRSQFLNQYVAQVAALAAVHDYLGHSIARRGDASGHDRRECAQAFAPLQAQPPGEHANAGASERRNRGTEVARAR